ncbi:hypothetical protein HYE82_36470 [Streptomyces sp. BR123]|uniref:hypothetical protein n=1 Tax=Streptomyces sp. BR123 TaxID=2749828 RepID=UPI0015C48272|nr:hypothetical protein [Streptomyces sp. BR123]NXY99769.1 hypothetical protein [Streptomyces sp. BR123]
MTTNENILQNESDIIPLDNHASGIEIKPVDGPAAADADITPMDSHAGIAKPAADEEIVSLDNHASGPRP